MSKYNMLSFNLIKKRYSPKFSSFFKNNKAMGDQVDWAVSLAIFLIFTFWFFIILRHYSHSDSILENHASSIGDKFKESVLFEFTQIPVFVVAEKDLTNVPVMIRNPIVSGNMTRYTMGPDIFMMIDDENLFFLANVSKGVNRFVIRHSETEYQMSYPGEFIYKSPDAVSVDSKQYQVRYPNNIMKEIFFQNIHQLRDYNFTLGGEYLDVIESSYAEKDAFIKHNITTDWFLQRSYVFPDNSYVLNVLDLTQVVASNTTLTLQFEIPRFDSYYVDTIIPYSLDIRTECSDLESRVLDLVSDEFKGLTFIFNRDVTFRICDESTVLGDRVVLYVDIKHTPADISKRTNFILYSHNQTYMQTKGDVIMPHDMRFGIRERFKGISRSKLLALTDKTPSQLMQLWNISENREFSIEVQNMDEEVLFSFRTSTPSVTDVFSRTFSEFLIDQYGNREFIFVNVNIW